jgi:hypothetical protein
MKRNVDWQTIPSAEDWGRRGLSAGGRRVAHAAIAAFLCDGAPLEPPDDAWCDRVIDSYDLLLGNASVTVRIAMRLILWLLEWLPFVVLRRASRMSKLSLEDRVAYIGALERHAWAPFTMLLVATKIPMTISAYEEGDALRMTGFDRASTAARRRLPLKVP